MSIFYIKDIKNIEDILSEKEKKMSKFVKKLLAGVKIKFGKFAKNGNIIVLPMKENQIVSDKKIKKIIENMLKKNICKTVVLNKNLNGNEELKNVLNSHNVNILDGRYLFRFLIFNIVDFILEKQSKKIQDIGLSVMINELDEINIKSIFILAKRVKR